MESFRQEDVTIWGFVRNYVHLTAADEHFQEKLMKALPEPTCAAEQGVLPGEVFPVRTNHLQHVLRQCQDYN